MAGVAPGWLLPVQRLQAAAAQEPGHVATAGQGAGATPALQAWPRLAAIAPSGARAATPARVFQFRTPGALAAATGPVHAQSPVTAQMRSPSWVQRPLVASCPQPAAVDDVSCTTLACRDGTPPEEIAAHRELATNRRPRGGSAHSAQPPLVRYVPIDQYDATRSRRGGSKVLLLHPPAVVPPSYTLSVHSVGTGAGAAVELSRRTLEASRLIPMLPVYAWVLCLDASPEQMAAWGEEKLTTKKLTFAGALGGHGYIASIRTTLHGLAMDLAAHDGRSITQAFDTKVGMTQLAEWLARVHEAAHESAMQRLIALGEMDDNKLEAAGASAASTRLCLLRNVVPKLFLKMSVTHAALDQYAQPPATRPSAPAPTPEFCVAAHYEMGAADMTDTSPAGDVVRGCFALAALNMHLCVRAALARRSGCLERAANDMGVARAGIDLKKHAWRASGRPLVCSTLGVSGTDTWFDLACNVLGEDGFDETWASLLRAHDGPDGDPSRATRFIDEPPSCDDWQKTLRHLSEINIHLGGRPIEGPSLGCPPSDGYPPATGHGLKSFKPCAYAVARVHSSILAEPGAWAGSKMERTSVQEMLQEIAALAPRTATRAGLAAGLKVARGYAATGLLAAAEPTASLAEIEQSVYAALRGYVREIGIQKLPRRQSWKHLANWLRAAGETPTEATPLARLEGPSTSSAPLAITMTEPPRVATSPWDSKPLPARASVQAAVRPTAPPMQPLLVNQECWDMLKSMQFGQGGSAQ